MYMAVDVTDPPRGPEQHVCRLSFMISTQCAFWNPAIIGEVQHI